MTLMKNFVREVTSFSILPLTQAIASTGRTPTKEEIMTHPGRKLWENYGI